MTSVVIPQKSTAHILSSQKPILFTLLILILSTGVSLAQSPNILLVIADDMGLDPSPGFLTGPTKANMPTLDSLRTVGLSFINVWSSPTCSPSRSSILTGKYASTTGVLEPGDILSTDEQSLFELIDEQSNGAYATSLIGKWHLGGSVNQNSDYPEQFGMDHFSGILGGGLGDYENWNLTSAGQTSTSIEYVTTKLTDLAIDWIAQQANNPWFTWLAYNAPHTPFHLPPSDLHSQGALSGTDADIQSNPLPYYLAAIEALDHELGRLIASIPPSVRENTIIIFVGDNGTPGQVAQAPFSRDKAKGSLYQGGVNVPMVISGAGVSRSGQADDALIGFTDLFATVAEMSGAVMPEIHDSRSFNFLLDGANGDERACAYAESLDGWTARDPQFKYISIGNGTEEFYDLLADSEETNSLIGSSLSDTQQAALEKLKDPISENSMCQVISTAESSESPSGVSEFQLYPNPSNSQVTVETSETKRSAYQLFDLQGRHVDTGFLDQGKNTISLERFPKGVYFLKASGQTKKIFYN